MENKNLILKNLMVFVFLCVSLYLGIIYLNKHGLQKHKEYCMGLTDSTKLAGCVEGDQKLYQEFPQEMYDLFYNQVDKHNDYKFYYGLSISYGFCERNNSTCNLYDTNILKKYLLKCASKMDFECSTIYFQNVEVNDESISLFSKNIVFDKEKTFVCRDEFKEFYKKIPKENIKHIKYSCNI